MHAVNTHGCVRCKRGQFKHNCVPFLSAAVGQLISRLTSDCYSITRCIATNVNVAMRNLLQVIGKVQAHNSSSSSSIYAVSLLSCLRAQHAGHSAVHRAALPSAQSAPAVTWTRQHVSRWLLCLQAVGKCIQHVSNVCPLVAAGGGAILAVLSPNLSGLCLAIFTTLWGFTIIYGSYSRHSQRVVQVRRRTAHALPQQLLCLGWQPAAGWRCYCGAAHASEASIQCWSCPAGLWRIRLAMKVSTCDARPMHPPRAKNVLFVAGCVGVQHCLC
jgi:hypothetical protein